MYSAMSETKAAFAERAIRSLKNVLYRYIENYGYKYIHKLPQFVTTLNTRRNRSIDMKPSNVKNADFMSVLYSKPIRDFNKPKLQVGHRVRISKQDFKIYRSEKDTSRNLQTKLLKLLHLLHANHPHKIYKMNKAKLSKASFMKRVD